MAKKITIKALALATLVAFGAGTAGAAVVVSQSFFDTATQSGGVIKFTDLGSNQLEITIDNTSNNWDTGGGYLNSSVITGIVFNVQADISSISSWSLFDGMNVDRTSDWDVGINVNNNITPGNTVFDIGFNTDNGINGGIYNADAPGTELNNAFKDIAKLILTIGTPSPWALTNIGSDSILRMQRVAGDGELSLKITTSSTSGGTSTTSSTSGGTSTSNGTIPEPGTLTLLGVAILGGLFQYRRRQQLRA